MMRENWQMTVHLVLKSEYETQKHLMFAKCSKSEQFDLTQRCDKNMMHENWNGFR